MTKIAAKAEVLEDNTMIQLKEVENQIKHIKGGISGEKRTSGIINFDGKEVNIHTVKDLSILIMCAAALLTRKQAYDNAAKALGITNYSEFKHSGASVDQWINDIQITKNVLEHKTVLKKLEKIRDELKECITKEERREAALSEYATLKAEFNDLPQLGE